MVIEKTIPQQKSVSLIVAHQEQDLLAHESSSASLDDRDILIGCRGAVVARSRRTAQRGCSTPHETCVGDSTGRMIHSLRHRRSKNVSSWFCKSSKHSFCRHVKNGHQVTQTLFKLKNSLVRGAKTMYDTKRDGLSCLNQTLKNEKLKRVVKKANMEIGISYLVARSGAHLSANTDEALTCRGPRVEFDFVC